MGIQQVSGENNHFQVLGSKNDTCQQSGTLNSTMEYTSVVRQVKNIELKDGGGGGGGATYVFTVSLRYMHAYFTAQNKKDTDGSFYNSAQIMYLIRFQIVR